MPDTSWFLRKSYTTGMERPSEILAREGSAVHDCFSGTDTQMFHFAQKDRRPDCLPGTRQTQVVVPPKMKKPPVRTYPYRGLLRGDRHSIATGPVKIK